MRAKRGEYATRARIHQCDAHHGELPAERRILDQHGEALFLQFVDAGQDAGVFRQHVGGHVGQGDLAFDDLALDRPFENFREALHLRFSQRVAGAHAVAEEEVVNQVGREVHDFAVRAAHVGQCADAALDVTGIGIDQMRGAQLAIGVVDRQAVVVEQSRRQRILAPRFEPALIRVMYEIGVGDVLAPELVVVEMIATGALDEFTQGRGEGAFLGRALAIGETHRRVSVADVQRPDVGNEIAPRGDLDLDAQISQGARHVGNRLLQRQILAGDIGACLRVRIQREQCLRIGVQVLDFLDHKLRPGLHHALDRATFDRAQDALAILVGEIGRQLDLDLEDLFVTVFRMNDVVVRQANVLGGNIARIAVELHEVGRAQGRRSQEVVERTRRRAVALVADRLVGDDREVVEFGLKTKLVEKIDLDFHVRIPKRCSKRNGRHYRCFAR